MVLRHVLLCHGVFPLCQAVTSMPAQAALITFLLLKPSTAQFIREVMCGLSARASDIFMIKKTKNKKLLRQINDKCWNMVADPQKYQRTHIFTAPEGLTASRQRYQGLTRLDTHISKSEMFLFWRDCCCTSQEASVFSKTRRIGSRLHLSHDSQSARGS